MRDLRGHLDHDRRDALRLATLPGAALGAEAVKIPSWTWEVTIGVALGLVLAVVIVAVVLASLDASIANILYPERVP